MDSASESVLAALVDAASGSRTLVLVTFRPGYHAPWMQKSSYQQVPIHSLGSDAVDELLEHLVGSDPSVLDLRALIADRTAGNPFFIEEVVQSLADTAVLDGSKGAYLLARPVAEVAIPETVQATLAARIDRLRARDKAVLQAGAVIGKEFSEALLARVAGLDEAELEDSLLALVAAELLFEEAVYPERDYRFKHPLTQEVAYRS
jgi:predicted ATPase